MKVFVYFNLHKKCFSIRALEGSNKGRVVAHRTEVYLTDAVFKVSEAGRQRVLREQRKNVHAGVTGYWTDTVDESELSSMDRLVKYNPYKYNQFVYSNQGTIMPVYAAPRAHLLNKQIFI